MAKKKLVHNRKDNDLDEILNPEKEVDATVDLEFYSYKGEPCYWRSKIMIDGNIVSGRVTTKQMKFFLDSAPKSINLDRWLFPIDKIEERKKVAQAKMKKRLGLTD